MADKNPSKYDDLSRGRKQEIDNERRSALKKAKDAPMSRMGDGVVDVARGVGQIAGRNPFGTGSARADYTSAREEKIRSAQDKADYKDLKSGPTKLFRDSSSKGMSDNEMAALKEFKVEEKAKGGAVKKMAAGGSVSSRGDGCAQRGKTRGKVV